MRRLDQYEAKLLVHRCDGSPPRTLRHQANHRRCAAGNPALRLSFCLRHDVANCGNQRMTACKIGQAVVRRPCSVRSPGHAGGSLRGDAHYSCSKAACCKIQEFDAMHRTGPFQRITRCRKPVQISTPPVPVSPRTCFPLCDAPFSVGSASHERHGWLSPRRHIGSSHVRQGPHPSVPRPGPDALGNHRG